MAVCELFLISLARGSPVGYKVAPYSQLVWWLAHGVDDKYVYAIDYEHLANIYLFAPMRVDFRPLSPFCRHCF